MGLRAYLPILASLGILPTLAGHSGGRRHDLAVREPFSAYRRQPCGGCRLCVPGDRRPVSDHYLLGLGTSRAATSVTCFWHPELGAVPPGKAPGIFGSRVLSIRPGALGQIAVRLDSERNGHRRHGRISQDTLETF